MLDGRMLKVVDTIDDKTSFSHSLNLNAMILNTE